MDIKLEGRLMKGIGSQRTLVYVYIFMGLERMILFDKYSVNTNSGKKMEPGDRWRNWHRKQ